MRALRWLGLALCLAAGCSGAPEGPRVREAACGVATRVCAAVEAVCTSGGESEGR